MDGKLVFRNAVQRMCEVLIRMHGSESTRDDIDLFVVSPSEPANHEYVANQRAFRRKGA